MKTVAKQPTLATTELLVLPDGQVLAHNLTSALAAVLAELNPRDEKMHQRARVGGASVTASREQGTFPEPDRSAELQFRAAEALRADLEVRAPAGFKAILRVMRKRGSTNP